jgi:signal transduction histidine kinase
MRNGRSSRTGYLVLAVVAVTFASVGAMAYVSIRLVERAVDDQVRSRVASTAAASAAAVDEEMRGLSEVVGSYAQRPFLVGAFGGSNPERYDRAQMRFNLRDLQHTRPGMSVVYATDPQGRLIDILPATPAIVGKSFRFRDWYRGVMRTRRPYVSTAYRSAVRGRPLVVAAAAPVRARDAEGRPGKLVGIVVAAYRLDHLSGFTDHFARVEGVQIRIFDRDGVLLAAPGPALRRLESYADQPLVAGALAGTTGLAEMEREHLLTASHPIPSLGWALTASLPEGTAAAATRGLRATLVSVALLLGLAVACGLALLARALGARDRAASEAARNAQVAAAVLDATRDGILMTDTSGETVVANAEYERLVSEILVAPARLTSGERTAAEIGALIGKRVADPERYRAGIANALGDPEQPLLDEYQVVATGRSYERHSGPVRSSEGELVGSILTIRDVTREREAERLKSELVATVSHELRSPLTGILGFTELLLRDADEPPNRAYLGTIYTEAQRLTGMINDFLDIQRIEEGSFTLALEPFDLAGLLRDEVAAAAGQSTEHELELEVPEEPLVVAGERDRLRQVLGNLVSNAIKYSPDGGTVRVVLERRGAAARVSVADEGLGIPAGEHERVFTKFFRVDSTDTRRIGGTGLGLALCHDIVEAHGGRIGFDSDEGEGSTFWFQLPLAGESAGQARTAGVQA